VGCIGGAHGLKGWVKINSYTDPTTNILSYTPWLVGKQKRRPVTVIQTRLQGKRIIAQLEGMHDRDDADALRGQEIAVLRQQLPETEPGEYYWSDLIGLAVSTVSGQQLGVVERLVATGSNDVLIVCGDRERWIPFIKSDVIKSVDLAAGCIEVDWDPDF